MEVGRILIDACFVYIFGFVHYFVCIRVICQREPQWKQCQGFY